MPPRTNEVGIDSQRSSHLPPDSPPDSPTRPVHARPKQAFQSLDLQQPLLCVPRVAQVVVQSTKKYATIWPPILIYDSSGRRNACQEENTKVCFSPCSMQMQIIALYANALKCWIRPHFSSKRFQFEKSTHLIGKLRLLSPSCVDSVRGNHRGWN
jgi:hypothetical protein